MESVKSLPRQSRGPLLILIVVAIVSIWPSMECKIHDAMNGETEIQGGEE